MKLNNGEKGGQRRLNSIYYQLINIKIQYDLQPSTEGEKLQKNQKYCTEMQTTKQM